MNSCQKERMQTHAGEKPISCEIFGSALSVNSNLKANMQILLLYSHTIHMQMHVESSRHNKDK